MEIREITAKDKAEIYKMIRVFYNSEAVFGDISDEIIYQNIDNCINKNAYIEGYVFEENLQIIGYSLVAKSYSTEYGGMCVWIEDVYLKPEYTGKGMFSKFFSYIEQKYQGKAVRIRLEVEENNQNAIKSYTKNGFKKLDYIEMTKVL